MSYNGWTNYDTWLYHLHNTDGICLEDYFDSKHTVECLADFLKEDAYEKIDENHLLSSHHKYEIKNKAGSVLFAGEGTSFRAVVECSVCERSSLREADLRGADLRGADLYGANLYEANLYGADLRGANLFGANLYGADLYGADLYRVNLRGADLFGADLRGANLYGANLFGANLFGANLYGADLRGANLVGAQIRKDIWLLGLKPVLVIGPIGSRSDYCTIYLTEKGVYVSAGCFFDTLDKFSEAVDKTHGDNEHGREYRAMIELARVHAECWMPDGSSNA